MSVKRLHCLIHAVLCQGRRQCTGCSRFTFPPIFILTDAVAPGEVPVVRRIILGNSHMPHVLHHLRNVWEKLEASVEGLRPIQWYAYPTSVTYVKKAGVTFEPQIEYCGFLNDDVLHEQLCEADFAIVPFNIHDKPEYPYARFSIPSRITEFVNAGLPIFAAAGKKTEACRFISGNGVGKCASIADETGFDGRSQSTLRGRAL